MMPLTFAAVGEENMIKKVGGKAETRKFLELSLIHISEPTRH